MGGTVPAESAHPTHMTRPLTGVAALILLPGGGTRRLCQTRRPRHPPIAGPATERAGADRNLVQDGLCRAVPHDRDRCWRVPNTGRNCARHVAESLPPQCGGPDIVGWDWKAVRAGVGERDPWGDYTVDRHLGRGRRAVHPDRAGLNRVLSAHPKPDLEEVSASRAPAHPPAGGWRPVETVARATQDTQDRASSASHGAIPTSAGLDRPVVPRAAAPPWTPERPEEVVLNVSFTKDLARNEAELRNVWGGALCVSKAPPVDGPDGCVRRRGRARGQGE